MALKSFPSSACQLSHSVDSSQWRSNWTTATVATPRSSWHQNILHPMLVNCHTLWTLCNGKQHGTNKKAQRINRLAHLERDLLTIYKYDPEVLASNDDLFDNPINRLLTFPPNENEKLIVSPRPIILQSRREARRHSTCHVRLLLTSFHPLRRLKPKRPIRPANPHPHSTPTFNSLITWFMYRIPTTLTRQCPPA
jgi:hypothetical protein